MTFFYGKRKELMEIWKPIRGYEGIYEVSNKGNFKSLDRFIYRGSVAYKQKGALKKTWKNKKGYLQVTLFKDGDKKHLIAHRIVAQTFIPNNENKSQVNHINGIKKDNRVENLEWCTNGENQIHRYQVLGHEPWNKGKKMKFKNSTCKTKRKVILNGVEYSSILDCARKTNRSTTYVYKHGIFE